jgi:hypothetical protein
MDDLTPFGLPLPASPDQAQLRLTNRDRQTLGCTESRRTLAGIAVRR